MSASALLLVHGSGSFEMSELVDTKDALLRNAFFLGHVSVQAAEEILARLGFSNTGCISIYGHSSNWAGHRGWVFEFVSEQLALEDTILLRNSYS